MLGDVTGFQDKDGRGHQDRFPHAHHLSLMEGFSVWFAFIQSGLLGLHHRSPLCECLRALGGEATDWTSGAFYVFIMHFGKIHFSVV